ncbi:MAG: hypothetical protein AAF621_05570 [Pseudomonadota bacterium]
MSDIDNSLEIVLLWAEAEIADKSNPPWARRAYENLINCVREVISSRKCTVLLGDLQPAAEHEGHVVQPEVCKNHTNIVPLRPQTVRVRMPM